MDAPPKAGPGVFDSKEMYRPERPKPNLKLFAILRLPGFAAVAVAGADAVTAGESAPGP